MQCPHGLFVVLSPTKKECNMKNNGFTIIELMIAIAIVGTLLIIFLRSPEETGAKTSKLEAPSLVAFVTIAPQSE